MDTNDEKYLHSTVMRIDGNAQGDVNAAKRYGEYMEREASVRLQVLNSYKNGEKVMDKSGLEACEDAYLGILHIQSLVKEAALLHTTGIAAIGNVTLPKIDAIALEAASARDKMVSLRC